MMTMLEVRGVGLSMATQREHLVYKWVRWSKKIFWEEMRVRGWRVKGRSFQANREAQSVSEERGIVKSGYLLVGMRTEGFLLDSPQLSSRWNNAWELIPKPSLSSAFGPSLHLCLCKMTFPSVLSVCVNHRKGLLKASFLWKRRKEEKGVRNQVIETWEVLGMGGS